MATAPQSITRTRGGVKKEQSPARNRSCLQQAAYQPSGNGSSGQVLL